MNKIVYPAKVLKNSEGQYTIDFIDLEGCITYGTNLIEALENAKEAMGLYLDDIDVKDYPKATIPFDNVKLENNEFITLIDLDIDEYRRKYDNRAVKKTLTIPNWLNTKAIEKDLNFSKILQNALKKELNIYFEDL